MYRFSTFCVVDIQLCGVLWVGCIIKSDCFLKAFQRLLAYKFQSQIYKEQVEPLLKRSTENLEAQELEKVLVLVEIKRRT